MSSTTTHLHGKGPIYVNCNQKPNRTKEIETVATSSVWHYVTIPCSLQASVCMYVLSVHITMNHINTAAWLVTSRLWLVRYLISLFYKILQ